MEKTIIYVEKSFKYLIAVVGGYFAGIDLSLKVLLLMMAFDLFTGWRIGKRGLSAKTSDGSFSSSQMKLGLEKKFFTLIYVAMGYTIDVLLQLNFIAEAITWYYIAYEIISISENATLLGVVKVPLLNKIVDFLIKVADKELE